MSNKKNQELLLDIKNKIPVLTQELIEHFALSRGQLLVLGCSSSEILGKHIGKGSSLVIGYAIVSEFIKALKPVGIDLAVQGCEHINRSLVVEEHTRKRLGLQKVSVVPQLHAGGSASVSAYTLFENPVMVEAVAADAGVDIGDTSIGQYVRFVQVPFRSQVKQLGAAHVVCLGSRPKLIGGERAKYVFNREEVEQMLAAELKDCGQP